MTGEKKYPNTLKGDLDALRDSMNKANLTDEELQILADYMNARLGWTKTFIPNCDNLTID